MNIHSSVLTSVVLLLASITGSDAKVHSASIHKNPFQDNYKDISYLEYVDSIKNKYVNNFVKNFNAPFVPFVEDAVIEDTRNNSISTRGTYGDLDAVIGEDEGRVGAGELLLRHGDGGLRGVVSRVVRREKRW